MASFISGRRNRIEELKEKYCFRTVEDVPLEELHELKRGIIRNPYGKMIGYVLKIIADKRKRSAEKVVIKLLREENELIVREKIIEVNPRFLIIFNGYIFLVRNIDEVTLNKIVKIGMSNVLTEDNLVLTREDDSVLTSPVTIGKQFIEGRTTMKAAMDSTRQATAMNTYSSDITDDAARDRVMEIKVKDMGLQSEDERRELELTLLTLKEKYENLRRVLHELTSRWFKGFISLDDYLAEQEKIRSELEEVKRLISGLVGEGEGSLSSFH